MDNIEDEENFYDEIDKDVESSDRPEDILVAHNSGSNCTGVESSNEVLNIVTEVGDNNIPHNNAISVQHIVEPVSELSVDNTSEASVPIPLPGVVAEAVPVDSLAENSRIEVDIAVEQEVKTHVEQIDHAMSSDKPELESSVSNADQEGEAVRQGQPPSQSSPHNEAVTGPDNSTIVSEIAKQHADTAEQVAIQHTEQVREEKESLRAAKQEEETVEKQAKKDTKKHINAATERIKKGKPAVKGESDQKGEAAAASDLAFLPTIQQKAGHAHRVRSLVKDRREAEASGESNWDDSLSSVRQAEKQRYEAVDQRRRDRLEARAQRLPEDGGEDSASVDSQTATMDGSKVAAFQLSAPHKPAARSRSYQTHRRNRKPAAAVAEDGAGRILLPPLVAQKQPHSSPHPRAALSSLLQESDRLSAMGGSGKPRKNRKPLYLRMIERAQQQYVEDEKNKVRTQYYNVRIELTLFIVLLCYFAARELHATEETAAAQQPHTGGAAGAPPQARRAGAGQAGGGKAPAGGASGGQCAGSEEAASCCQCSADCAGGGRWHPAAGGGRGEPQQKEARQEVRRDSQPSRRHGG